MTLRHSVTWRVATQDELERTGCAGIANLTDGAGAVLVDGELVGICNEYGTCIWHAEGGEPDPLGNREDAIERLNQAVCDL